MKYSYGKERRLVKADDFARVFRDGESIRNGLWRVLFCRCDDTSMTRFGVVVSKRHASKAVARNRLKRIARESFRLTFPTDRGGAGADIVAYATQAAAAADNAACAAAIRALLRDVDARLTV